MQSNHHLGTGSRTPSCNINIRLLINEMLPCTIHHTRSFPPYLHQHKLGGLYGFLSLSASGCCLRAIVVCAHYCGLRSQVCLSTGFRHSTFQGLKSYEQELDERRGVRRDFLERTKKGEAKKAFRRGESNPVLQT
jgi:hypothetical protein